MSLIITSTYDELLMVSTSMTLNDPELPKQGVLMFFLQFLAAAHISRVNCAKLEDPDNLRV